MNRRTLLGKLTLSAGATALINPFLRREAAAQSGVKPPLRLVVIHTADGRPPNTWMPTAVGTDFKLGPALAPFEDGLPHYGITVPSLHNDLVVISGLNVLRTDASLEPHCGAFQQWMTGMPGVTKDNYTSAQGPSFDQILVNETNVAGNTAHKSLQLAGDMTNGTGDVSHRYMSWGYGVNKPLPGTHKSLDIYNLLFGNFAPGQTAAEKAKLTRLVRRRQSVLDLLNNDWKRMSDQVPAAQRVNFDAHLDAIRSLEKGLQTLEAAAAGTGTMPGQCQVPAQSETDGTVASIKPTGAPGGVNPALADASFPKRYALNLKMLRLALACDLTRVATFLSTPTGSDMSHAGWIPELGGDLGSHHQFTHEGKETQLKAIGTWYAAQVAQFVNDLKKTPDGAGNLLDNTLVYYASEQGYGFNGHDPNNVPTLLFGNAGGQVKTGRHLNFMNNRQSTNDLWISIGRLFGRTSQTFGTPGKFKGPLPGFV